MSQIEYPFSYAILIGRFQPFHNAHAQLLQQAFEQAQQVIVALGSHRVAPNIKNPWTTAQRQVMITRSISPPQQARLSFVYLRDYLYNDNLWAAELQAQVAAITRENKSIALIGHRKDSSSYYLEGFPQWQYQDFVERLPINATQLRESYLRGTNGWQAYVPLPVQEFLLQFAQTDDYARLAEEQKFIDQYKKEWSVAPHPPIFVTVDAVVFKSGHILVVKRRGFPGKGQLALPGGFVGQSEWLEHAAIRELREETGIALPANELRKFVRASRVFDHPERSVRGRTITHGYYLNLGAVGDLPQVKGGDDAAKAFWMSLNDVYVNEDHFFEDHVSIITHFVNRF
ncbi:MAG TPA: bifunctional nicotinamide-nucleotide adenylyltransferase/Nudix hydroxylase [Anaerolineae bacterium]|nr:bifunctional nicotinamide-nucleotide adenylyltransferase/Nudix hydroxylase [Anaerolineae bacterium]